MQTPTGRRAFQGNSHSRNVASSSKVDTPLRRTRARFAEPVFIPDRDSESESALDYSQPIPSASTSSQQEQQSGSNSASSSPSFPSLPSPPPNTNSAVPTEPIINSEPETGFGGGWVQYGSDLRRESILPPAVLAQFQAEQQASIAKRAEEAYHEHTKEMMRQHDLTYQWYDRMMTEGLQNEDQAATGAGAAAGAPGIIDDAMTDVGSNDSEEIRDSSMEDGEASRDSNMENGTEADTGDVKRFTPRRLIIRKTKQYQPCPPGVQYSLQSTPTLILPPHDDH